MEELPQSPAERYVDAEIAEAEAANRNINDTAVRLIAGWWHGGQSSALYSLPSSGAILTERLKFELMLTYADPNMPEQDLRKLDCLSFYIMEKGDRDAQEGWHELTTDARITELLGKLALEEE